MKKSWKRTKRIVLVGVVVMILVLVGITSHRIYFNYSFGVSETENIKSATHEVLAKGLDTIWAIDFLPDGTLIFTERHGRVNLIVSGKVQKIADIEVNEVSEAGLLGLAVDPNYVSNKYIYLYYTHSKANRVSRYILENQRLVNETILLDDIPSARFHDGGRIKFGPDGKLYITTGDATDLSSAQNLNSLAGKILRMNKDGSIPKDNPFQNYVYSYGHRNPQGLAWDNNQQLFSSEHGPTRNDEFNKIVMGKNYGWPQQCDQTGNFINPVRCFTEFTLAPGSLAFHKGDFFVTGLRGKQLRKLRLDLNKVQNEQVVLSDLGRIREVVSHKGDLYVGTSNRDGRGLPKVQDDKIIKLQIVN